MVYWNSSLKVSWYMVAVINFINKILKESSVKSSIENVVGAFSIFKKLIKRVKKKIL